MWPSTSTKEKTKTTRSPPHSTDIGKVFSYSSTSIHHEQSGFGVNISQHNKSYLGPTHSKHNTQGWQMDSIPTKIWKKKGSPLASPLFNMELEVLPTAIRQETILKGTQIGRKEVEHSQYSGNVTLYRQHPKDATHQLLALVNKFIMAAGYNIDIRKSFPFLHANNEISETKETKQSHLSKQNNPI